MEEAFVDDNDSKAELIQVGQIAVHFLNWVLLQVSKYQFGRN